MENNHFGTHEFMDLCDLLGADAYVNGNVGSGTVQEMADWVEYLTRGDDSPMARLRRENGRDEPWKVPFWGLGNEAWGCGGNMSAEHYAEEARRYATFCRNHGDNKLTRIAAGANEDDLHWTRALMKSLTECLGCTLYGAKRVPGGVVPLLHALRIGHQHRGRHRLHARSSSTRRWPRPPTSTGSSAVTSR